MALRTRDSVPMRPAPVLSKAAIIGIAIGGLYIVIMVVIVTIWILSRRKKRRLNAENEKNLAAQSASFLGFNEYFTGPRSTMQSPDSQMPLNYQPQVHDRRRFSSENNPAAHTAGQETTDPFWMFDGAYGESEVGSLRRNNSTLSRPGSSAAARSSWLRPVTAGTLSLQVPTDVFVEQMHAQYPEAVRRSSENIAVPLSSLAALRSKFRRGTNTTPQRKGSRLQRRPTASRQYQQNYQYQQAATRPATPPNAIKNTLPTGQQLLPPIPIRPLMHKDSMERIVGHIMNRPTVQRSLESEERIRMGSTKVRKVKGRKNAHSAHSRSLSVLSERLFKRFDGNSSGNGQSRGTAE